METDLKKEIEQIKDKYNSIMKEEIKKIKEKYKKDKAKKRKTIPKSLRDKVWDIYVGKEKGVSKCYCCDKEIDSKCFDCGHVKSVAHGGLDIVENLKPICSTCNKSMGTQNLEEFKNQYFPVKTLYNPMICKCGNIKSFLQEKCAKCSSCYIVNPWF